MRILLSIVFNAVALYATALVVPGISFHGNLVMLLVAGGIFGLFNLIVRPVALLLSLPLLIVTLGLFLLVLNAFCLWLVSVFVAGFQVAGFWPAFWGALLVSVVSWILTALISDRGRVEVIERRR